MGRCPRIPGSPSLALSTLASLALLFTAPSSAPAQDCGGDEGSARVFVVTSGPSGATSLWEVDFATDTYTLVLQPPDALTAGFYEPTRDRLYFGSLTGGIYRVAPDGSGYEEVVAPGVVGFESDCPLIDPAGDLYVNTAFASNGIWSVSPPDPGGSVVQVVPPYSSGGTVGLAWGSTGVSAGGLLGVGSFGPPEVILSNPPGDPPSTFIDLSAFTSFAFDCAVRASGNVLVSDPSGSQVLEFDTSGTFVGVFADFGDGLGFPTYMECNLEDDSVLVLDLDGVHLFAADGSLLATSLVPDGESAFSLAIIQSSSVRGTGSSREPSPPLPQASMPGFCPCSCDAFAPWPGARGLVGLGGDLMLHSGEILRAETDFVISCVGPDLVWRRTFRGQVQDAGSSLGAGWTHTYDEVLSPSGENLVLTDGSGVCTQFVYDSTPRWIADEHFAEITPQGDRTFLLSSPDGGRMVYAPIDGTVTSGKLTRTEDRHGNGVTLSYDAAGDLVGLDHDDGQSVALSLDGAGRITSATIPGVGSYEYEYAIGFKGAGAELVSVTTPAVTGTPNGNDFPLGKTTTYTYSAGFAEEALNHNLLSVTTPLGNTTLEYEYAATTDPSDPDFDRVVRKVWGDAGDNVDLVYVAVTPDAGNGFAVQKTIVNDRVGNVSELFFDAFKRLVMRHEYTGRADPDLPTTDSSNRPSGKLRPGDPDFFETRWTWNEDAKITLVERPEGDFTQYVYERDLDASASPLSRGNLREVHEFPGPRGGDQGQIDLFFEYLTGFGGCCGSSFVTRATDGKGNDTVHSYDASANRIQTEHRIPGIVESFEYDAFGRVTKRVFPSHGGVSAREDVFTYYGPADGLQNGRLKSVVRDAGGLALTRTFAYDERGEVVQEVDERGHDTQTVRNQLGQVMQVIGREVTDGSGLRYEQSFFYDADDRVVQVEVDNVDGDGAVDPLNPTWTTTFQHGVLGEVTRVEREVSEDGSGSVTLAEEYAHDANRNPVLRRKGEAVNGSDAFNVVATSWDERDLLFQTVRAAGHPTDASTTQVDYDRNGNRVAVHSGLEAGARTTSTIFDGFNRPRIIADPMGNRAIRTFDANANVLQVLLEGELVDVAGSAGNVRLAQVDSVLDVMDRVVQEDARHFDPVTQADLGDGSRTRTSVWAAASLPLQSTDDDGQVTTYVYDSAHRLSSTQDPKGNVASYTYDASSNLVRVTETERSDLGGPDEVFVTDLFFDNLDRMVSSLDNLGFERSTARDSRGLPMRVTNARGNVSEQTFDGLGRLVRTVRDLTDTGDGGGSLVDTVVMTQDWDDSGRLRSRTDANGNATTSTHDALDRVVGVAFADCTDESFAFDAHDDLLTHLDANQTLVTQSYDALGRQVRQDVVPGPGVSADTTFVDRIFDGASRVVGAGDDDSLVSRHHDSLSRTLDETQDGQVVARTYDDEGNLLTQQYPGGRALTRSYDALDLLSTVKEGAAVLADLLYRGPGRLVQEDLGNGTRLSVGYDGLNRPESMSHVFDPAGAATVLDERRFTWDASWNKVLVEDVRAGRELRMAYDSLDRMVESVTTRPTTFVSYALDPAGNRTRVQGGEASGRYRLDARACEPADLQMNQYTSTPRDRRRHDAAGNLTARTPKRGGRPDPESTAPPTQHLDHDYRGRLVEVRDIGAGRRHVYAYDPFGRRIARTLDADGAANTTRYLYHGWQVVEEQDGGGQTLATYVFGNGLDAVITMRRDADGDGAPEDYFYHADDLGSVAAVTDASGQVVERYRYGDYGAPTILSPAGNRRDASAIGNPLLFTGRRFDPETGLYYSRNRYLDPVAGRFISRDPIGAFGDAVNLGNALAYVGNNPASRVDPLGLNVHEMDMKFEDGLLPYKGRIKVTFSMPWFGNRSPWFGDECLTGTEKDELRIYVNEAYDILKKALHNLNLRQLIFAKIRPDTYKLNDIDSDPGALREILEKTIAKMEQPDGITLELESGLRDPIAHFCYMSRLNPEVEAYIYESGGSIHLNPLFFDKPAIGGTTRPTTPWERLETILHELTHYGGSEDEDCPQIENAHNLESLIPWLAKHELTWGPSE